MHRWVSAEEALQQRHLGVRVLPLGEEQDKAG